MRIGAFQVLVVVGGILVLSGTSLVSSSFDSGVRSGTLAIPAGGEWYNFLEFEVLGSGELSAEFFETSARTVDVHVFPERQYIVYAFIGRGSPLFSMDGAFGHFSVRLPASGRYYLIFDHGAGYDGTPQEVQITFRVEGIDPALLWVGSALAGGGSVFAVLALVSRQIARRRKGGTLLSPDERIRP